jgi:seryl-tRNA synthetase
MLNTSKSEEHTEEQDCGVDTLQFLKELEEEAKSLNEEKINLMDLQEKLWFRISEEIENKRQKNEKLKKEVEELKKKCEEISRILNTYVQKQETNSVLQVSQI